MKYYWSICKKLKDLYINIIYFWLGSGLAQLTVNLGKYYIGRLRPHFLFVCKPNIDCKLIDQYITNYTCTNPEVSLISDARYCTNLSNLNDIYILH